MALSEEEKRIIAYTLLGEAAGEGKTGMEAVMAVIVNRANSGQFPDNPASVAIQSNSRGVHQFSAWNTGDVAGGNSPVTKYSETSPAYQKAMAIVNAGLEGTLKDPTGGALYYYSGSEPAYFSSVAKAGTVTIGGHTFAKGESALSAINNAAPTPAGLPDRLSYLPELGDAMRTATVSEAYKAAPNLPYTSTLGWNDGQQVKQGEYVARVIDHSAFEDARAAADVGGLGSVSDARLFNLVAPQYAPTPARDIPQTAGPAGETPAGIVRTTAEGLDVRSVQTVKIGADGKPIVAAPPPAQVPGFTYAGQDRNAPIVVAPKPAGTVKTTGGIAGTAQLPADVVPRDPSWGPTDGWSTISVPGGAINTSGGKDETRLVSTTVKTVNPEYVAWQKAMDAYDAAAANPNYIPYSGYGDPNGGALTQPTALPPLPGPAPEQYITTTKQVSVPVAARPAVVAPTPAMSQLVALKMQAKKNAAYNKPMAQAQAAGKKSFVSDGSGGFSRGSVVPTVSINGTPVRAAGAY